MIPQNFRCCIFKSRTKTFHRTVFVGHRIDAEIALEVYESAYHFITRYAQSIASYAYRYQGTSKGVRDEWSLGFITGLEQGFKDQIKTSTETALMLLIPQEVNDHITTMNLHEENVKPLLNRNGDAISLEVVMEMDINLQMVKNKRVLIEDFWPIGYEDDLKIIKPED